MDVVTAILNIFTDISALNGIPLGTMGIFTDLMSSFFQGIFAVVEMFRGIIEIAGGL